MVELYGLPSNTRRRVARCVEHLTDFPNSGAPLLGRWEGYRFVLGPWPWMLIIYELVDDGLVAVVAFEDSRKSDAATADP